MSETPSSSSPVLLPSSLGTVFATLAGNHFDVVKTRQMMGDRTSVLQLLRTLVRTEGKGVLFSGMKPALLAGVAGNACYFFMYETLKARATDAVGPLGYGLTAFASRATAVALMIPVEVMRTRAYAGTASALQQVSMFRGLQTQVWRDVLWSALCWQVYETTTPRLRSFGLPDSLCSILSAVSAGLVASVLTHPLDLLKTRLQVGGTMEENTLVGLKELWRTDRGRMFTLGLNAHCFKTAANMSLGSMLETGPPAALTKLFSQLESPDLYTSKNQEKLVQVLHTLTIDYKKRYNTSNVTELTTLPAMKKMLQQLPSVIKESSADNSVKLMRSLSFLRIRDKGVWAALERRFSLVLHQVTEANNVVYAIECFHRAGQDSPRLWNALESSLLSHICPKHSLSARAVASVLHSFSSMDKGSQQLLEAMEQQVIRVAPMLDGGDLAKVISVFAKVKYGGGDLFKLLNRQCKLVCSQMSVYELSMVLCVFLRMERSTMDLLDKIEDVLGIGFAQMNAKNVSSVMEAYALHLREHTLVEGRRREFVKFLAHETFKSYDRLFPADTPDVVRPLITFAYSLSLLKLSQNLAILKRILDDLRSRKIGKAHEMKDRLIAIQVFFNDSHIS